MFAVRSMITGAARVTNLQQSRVLSMTGVRMFNDNNLPILPSHAALKTKQKQYRVNDGRRVHEKENKDKFLHIITVVFLIAGTIEFTRVCWTLAYPNWETFLTMKRPSS